MPSNGERLRRVARTAPHATCVQATPPRRETARDDVKTRPAFRVLSIDRTHARRRPAFPLTPTLRCPAFRQAETTSDKSANYRCTLLELLQGGCALRQSGKERWPVPQRTRGVCRVQLRWRSKILRSWRELKS